MLCGVATSFAMLLLFRIGVAVGEAGGTAPSVAMVAEVPMRRIPTTLLKYLMLDQLLFHSMDCPSNMLVLQVLVISVRVLLN